MGRLRSLSLVLATLIAVNLAYYELDSYAFQRTTVVQTADLFDSPPDRDGSVPRFPGFSYRLARPISAGVFQRYFGSVARTGDALEDALAVARRVRELYVHGRGGSLYPWVPDEGIPRATTHPVVCDVYARTQVSALEHMGHVSRVVYLQGHVAPEVYDFARQGWIYVDPNGGVYLSTPEGSMLSLARFGDRLRLGQPFVVHRIDASTDDPQYMFENVGSDSIYRNVLKYEDGPGMQYRRKSLFHIGRMARLIVYRHSEAPFRLGWLWGVLTVNAVTAGCIAAVFLVWRSRRQARARRGSMDAAGQAYGM